jgi:CheY-like chemotaxis protein
MSSFYKFLVVDDNPDSRFLLVKTLLRKFPQAILQETQDGESALELTRSQELDALVVHRSAEVDGITLVRMLREVNQTVPIVMVSGIDRSKTALEAGATTFLSYEAWLRIGSIVAEILPVKSDAAATADTPDTAAAGQST